MVCRFAPAGILFGSGFNHSDKRDGVLPGQGGLPPGAAPNRVSIPHAKLKLWAYWAPEINPVCTKHAQRLYCRHADTEAAAVREGF